MIIKHSANASAGWLTGLGILLVGLALGALLDPLQWLRTRAVVDEPIELSAPAELAAFLRPNPKQAPAADNGLETLNVEFEPAAAATLQKVRDAAANRGVIIQAEDDTIEGRVGMHGKLSQADLRIKGDWTDHVATDKWSLRIKLDKDKLNGMSVFSVQHPRTRGMLWEWLVLFAARREGLLAPRSSFVNVVINGNPMGVYYLEEHFSKELLESQKRREGPIVLWDESSRWSTQLQVHDVYTKDVMLPTPNGSKRAMTGGPADIRGYGAKRMGSIESLNRSMYSAAQQMQALQAASITRMGIESPLRRMQARETLRGETIDTLLDTDKLAQMHALIALFQIWHALVWHNMRYYHDPVLDRLEPILFDCNAHKPSARDIPMFREKGTLLAEFGSSQKYYNGVFRHLAYFTAPGYLEGLMQDCGDKLRVFEAALLEEFKLPTSFTVEGMLQRLRTEQAFLRTSIYPSDPVNFQATHDIQPSEAGGAVSGTLSVDCWTTTRAPVEVRGFEFSNGVVVPAADLLLGEPGGISLTDAGGVILPTDGSPIRLQFSTDGRLASLENVRQVLDIARGKADSLSALDLNLKVLFRCIAAEELEREALRFRHVDPTWAEEGGRPKPPSLQDALDRYPFLEYRAGARQLWLRSGDWIVQGDLVVPDAMALHGRDARLQFDSDSALISSAPLNFTRVVLEPQAGHDRWRGVVVLQAAGRSEWTKVTVRATDAISRGGWVVTGGITFYRSPVSMLDCHIDGTWAEDGTNIFGTDFSMERVTFSACLSDSFDGDFVTGSLKNCVFKDGLADGVDVSGSQILVENCKFLNMGDKGISAGEDSQVTVLGGVCREVSIGIASKDRSQVTASGMLIEGARNYALAVFIKKPAFGAASLKATKLKLSQSGLGDALVQTGCTLEIDGQLQATQDLDVKQLYKDKILGQ